MKDAETWLTAEQRIEFGLADRFAEEDADMSTSKDILQKAYLNMQQRIDIQKSLAAQLRQLVSEKQEPAKPQEPAQKNDEPPTLMSVLGGIKNKED